MRRSRSFPWGASVLFWIEWVRNRTSPIRNSPRKTIPVESRRNVTYVSCLSVAVEISLRGQQLSSLGSAALPLGARIGDRAWVTKEKRARPTQAAPLDDPYFPSRALPWPTQDQTLIPDELKIDLHTARPVVQFPLRGAIAHVEPHVQTITSFVSSP